MAVIHLTGAVGVICFVAVFPSWILGNLFRIIRNHLWDDEHEAVIFGAFYAGFKKRLWWFWLPCHSVNGIGLGVVQVIHGWVRACVRVCTDMCSFLADESRGFSGRSSLVSTRMWARS